MALTLEFAVPAADGTYTGPIYNENNISEFGYVLSFEFYDDEALTEVSTGVTGTITVNGKMTPNGIWQNIPVSTSPSTVDASNPLSLSFSQALYQLQIITSGMMNTNYIKLILIFIDRN